MATAIKNNEGLLPAFKPNSFPQSVVRVEITFFIIIHSSQAILCFQLLYSNYVLVIAIIRQTHEVKKVTTQLQTRIKAHIVQF